MKNLKLFLGSLLIGIFSLSLNAQEKQLSATWNYQLSDLHQRGKTKFPVKNLTDGNLNTGLRDTNGEGAFIGNVKGWISRIEIYPKSGTAAGALILLGTSLNTMDLWIEHEDETWSSRFSNNLKKGNKFVFEPKVNGGPMVISGGKGMSLELMEIKVFGYDKKPNLSTATSSSVYQGRVPSRVIDGNTSGDSKRNSITTTNKEAGAWISIDLGETQTINGIEAYNVTCSSCLQRAGKYYAMISDRPFDASKDVDKSLKIAKWKSVALNDSGKKNWIIPVPRNTKGRYVRLQFANDYTNYMNFAEIRVLTPGVKPGRNLGKSTPFQSSGSTGGTSTTKPMYINMQQQPNVKDEFGKVLNTAYLVPVGATSPIIDLGPKLKNNKRNTRWKLTDKRKQDQIIRLINSGKTLRLISGNVAKNKITANTPKGIKQVGKKEFGKNKKGEYRILMPK